MMQPTLRSRHQMKWIEMKKKKKRNEEQSSRKKFVAQISLMVRQEE